MAKLLPHHWIIGEVGGMYVDRHDHIWVYHRPRSLISTTDSGMQGIAGKDTKGNPISAMGFPRPNGRRSGCCTPAPSVLEFDKDGNLLQAWGGPGDPDFFETKCRQQDGCFWPAREHGIYVDQNGGVGRQAGEFHWPHVVSVDSDGNVYVGEVEGSARIQKFLRYGATGCSGTGNAEIGKYDDSK